MILLGTGSHAGKSVLTAGLCRILYQDGYRVAPFKAQNMALNSFITADGKEMGRAQVVQAQACGLAPEADMNPILLKPNSDTGAQVILNGLVHGNMNAVEYHAFKPRAAELVKAAFDRLADRFDAVICEGAGSPAEINLREGDLVNMGLAEMIDAPCLLIGDIDRGGVFASLVGTMELLEPWERDLIKGFVINKFRGDVSLLKSGLDFLEERCGKPVLGVAPHVADLFLPEEDGVAVEAAALGRRTEPGQAPVTVVVPRLPHISNFTDFDALAAEPSINLIYAHDPAPVDRADAVILAGTKNTIEDLIWLIKTGFAGPIDQALKRGAMVVGVCGGYQMLGTDIADPERVESSRSRIDGLGLLPVVTTMAGRKEIHQVRARVIGPVGLPEDDLIGYEIHMGRTDLKAGAEPILRFTKDGRTCLDGAVGRDGLVWGSYLHGLFDNDDFRRWFIDRLYLNKGLTPPDHGASPNYTAKVEASLNKLAETLRHSLDMDRIYKILGL